MSRSSDRAIAEAFRELESSDRNMFPTNCQFAFDWIIRRARELDASGDQARAELRMR